MSQNTSPRRLLAAWLVSALAAGGAVFGVVAPASAAPQDYCSSGTACMWDDTSYQTNGDPNALVWFEYYIDDMSNMAYRGTSTTASNTADSWYNNGVYATARFYDVADYQGSHRDLDPQEGDGNIANNAGIIQDVDWDPNSAEFI